MPYPRWDDLWRLADANPDDAEVAVRQVYEWRHGRLVSMGLALFGAAGSFLATLAIAIIRQETQVPAKYVAMIAASSGVLLAAGLILLLSARRIHEEFLFAVALLALLRRGIR